MLEFANPSLLPGLAAIALPVLAHLLTRARPRPIRFPAYRLLLDAGGGRQALSRLRTLLVLALRTLALAALALAFLRPYWLAHSGQQPENGARRAVIILDTSLSMTASAGGVELFAQAATQAADLLRSFGEGTQAGLILAGREPTAALPALSANLPALHQALEKARCTAESCNAPDALALAARWLDGGGTVYLFTDLQRTNWAVADFSRYPGISFVVKPVALREPDNVGLAEIHLSPAEPLPDEPVTISCRVFNSTPAEKAVRVGLDFEGKGQRETEIHLPPFASAIATFELSLPEPGFRSGKISIPEDALPGDNRRSFFVRVRPRLQALLISDEAQNAGSAAALAGLAFAPPGSGSGIALTARRGSEVDAGTAEACQVFLVVPPVSLDGGAAGLIAQRIRDGAAGFFFLDNPHDAAILQTLESVSGGLLRPPFEPQGQALLPKAEAGVSLTPAGLTKLPLLANPTEADFAGVRFARYLTGRTLPERAEEIWLTYADGTPALSLGTAGRGMAVFLNMPLAPDAGTLTGSPLFPALLRELLLRLRSGSGGNEAEPGAAWELLFSGSGVRAPVTLSDPDNNAVEARLLQEAGAARMLLPAASLCGVYAARSADGQEARGVVNPDPRESDLRGLPTTALAAPTDGTVIVATRAGELLEAGQPRALWPHLLLLAGLALLAETALLAWWRKGSARRGGIFTQGEKPTEGGTQ